MSVKMDTFVDVISTVPIKDSDGFVTHGDNILASVRAERVYKGGGEKIINAAVFSDNSVVFRFRVVPNLEIKPSLIIVCDTGRYEIKSFVERGKMYVECATEKVEGSE
jgi:hypothetical protein